MDYSQASWWCRCSLFQHGILIFRTKLCFNIFNASGAVKCRYRCVFYKLVPDKNSMDAISGCQALHCATLSRHSSLPLTPERGGAAPRSAPALAPGPPVVTRGRSGPRADSGEPPGVGGAGGAPGYHSLGRGRPGV